MDIQTRSTSSTRDRATEWLIGLRLWKPNCNLPGFNHCVLRSCRFEYLPWCLRINFTEMPTGAVLLLQVVLATPHPPPLLIGTNSRFVDRRSSCMFNENTCTPVAGTEMFRTSLGANRRVIVHDPVLHGTGPAGMMTCRPA